MLSKTIPFFVLLGWLGFPALLPAQSLFANPVLDEIAAVQAELDRVSDALRSEASQRDALAFQHEQLAEKIRSRKLTSSAGALLPDLELGEWLRQAQQLSERLLALNRQLESLAWVRRERLERMAALYDRIIEEISRQIRGADRLEQTALVASLSDFQAQRDRLRSELSVPLAPDRQLSSVGLLNSEDPEILTQRGDAVRDEQDRKRRELLALDTRIAEVENELRLHRELADFMGDQAVFGEEGRLLRTTKTETHNSPSPGVGDYDDEAGGRGHPANGDRFSGKQSSEGPTVIVTNTQAPVRVGEGMGSGETRRPTRDVRALKKQRETVVEEIKNLQKLYDQLREKTEGIDKP